MKSKLYKILVKVSKICIYSIIVQLSVFTFAFSLDSKAQQKSVDEIHINLSINNPVGIEEVFTEIERTTDFKFSYIDGNLVREKIRIDPGVRTLGDLLRVISAQSRVAFKRVDETIYIKKLRNRDRPIIEIIQPIEISGIVLDENEEPLPGATVVEMGTTNGTTTDVDGTFTIRIAEGSKVLISFVGYSSREIDPNGESYFTVQLQQDITNLDEVIVVGYGTAKKQDLTGSVVRADIGSFSKSANTSVLASLQGTVPGLSVGQITRSGQEAELLIRGQSTISGETRPLIVVDGVIFRGNLVDLNPNDIASVDVLKDASAAAIYGSQATNGVIIFTTKKGDSATGKPIINIQSSYSFQQPSKEMPPAPEEYDKALSALYYKDSRTAESGYTEPNPDWDPRRYMTSSEEITGYENGVDTDWYGIVTNDHMFQQNHNLSIANSSEYMDLFTSLGYTEQAGYVANDDFSRISARINLDTRITDFLTIGAQTFFTVSDYSGTSPGAELRYLDPYAPSHDPDGNRYKTIGAGFNNPLNTFDDDNLEKRLNLYGLLYAKIDIPFVKGLSYRINYNNQYRTNSYYLYTENPENNFNGFSNKDESRRHDWTLDNILSYSRTFADDHKVDVTLLTGAEKIGYTFTSASASQFASNQLGYNKLEAGDASLRGVNSDAWEESSLYSMARLFYSYKNKYLITGTIRRDGFSGFSEENKFGVFPSLSLAWVMSEESFFDQPAWVDFLKLRASYGTVGNRTIGRYATKARVGAGFNYITYDGTPQYTKYIESLASPNLKWEKTTGLNIGLDFAVLNERLSGSIDYYNNNTTNLLYDVDIPSITRYSQFPDNLGKLHNHGMEFTLTSLNVKNHDFEWKTTANLSFDRNRLVTLLGLDPDGDGVENDLISEGLFIGESINSIYTYEINGIWQLDDEVPVGYDVGSYKVVDQNNDGKFTPDDRKIIGYSTPAYRFGISNSLTYKSWSLFFFINSIQGGKKYYYGEDYIFYSGGSGADQLRKFVLPTGFDYWSPSNPDAFYEKPQSNSSGGLAGRRYTQRNFVRLQDISLAYNFRPELLSRLKINSLQLYVSGKNLFTLTKWNGWDPETGITTLPTGLPIVKGYTVGIDLKF